MKKVTVSKFEKVGEKEFQRVVFFFKEKKDHIFKYHKIKNLQKFKDYVQENTGWVCNCKYRCFKTNTEIKLFNVLFYKILFKDFRKKKENFLILKQLFEKYK